MIIFVFGLPGSGKSYFASRLAELIDAEHLSSDRLRKEMFEQSTYSDKEKEAVYLKMLEKMKSATAQKKHLVLDATFHKNNRRKLFTDEIKEAGVSFIEVWADDKITRQRLKYKRPDSDADYEVHKLIKQHWEPLEEPHLLLQSTNNNIDNMLQSALQHLHWKDDKRTTK